MKLLKIAALLLLLQACQKDKQTTTQSGTSPAAYLPLKAGNYWVYKVTIQNGAYPNYTINEVMDTLRIDGDTTINGSIYYLFKGSNYQLLGNNSLLRDSSGVLVYSNGVRYPLSLTANDTLASYASDGGAGYRVYSTGNTDTLINVTAGAFQSSEMVLDYYYTSGPPPVPNANPRTVLHYYAKGIGLVKSKTWYSSSPGDIISELQSYHIEP